MIANARKLGIDALIVIGGDGTQKIALDLQRKGLNVVGVPKTIDNDLSATEITFGFDTALHTATEAIDKLHTTAESHHRIMVVEVMGRDTGWIALEAGIAGGAHVILIPEMPFTVANIRRYIEKRLSIGKRFTIIVIAEGCPLPVDMQKNYGEERRKLPRFGAIGNLVGQELGRELKREVRVAVLGHIQRGGSPSPGLLSLSSGGTLRRPVGNPPLPANRKKNTQSQSQHRNPRWRHFNTRAWPPTSGRCSMLKS